MERHELRMSADAFAEAARRLTAHPDRLLTMPAGLAGHSGGRLWLAHRLGASAGPRVVIAAAETSDALSRALHTALAASEHHITSLALAFGVGTAAGRVAGLCRTAAGTAPLHAVTLAGPSFLGVRLRPEDAAPGDGLLSPTEVFSRTIGALGADAFARLRRLRVAVVGCGRTGSLAAEALAAMGVARLTLVDADLLEPHNLGEMAGVSPDDLGRPKAAALADTARRQAAYRGTDVVAAASSVLALPALFALKPADVLVSCANSPSARLACAAPAALYLQPLLDIGTGVLTAPGGRRMGLDVRLIFPGRCLLCLGGVAAHAGGFLPRPPARRVAAGLASVHLLASGRRQRLVVPRRPRRGGRGTAGLARPAARRHAIVERPRPTGDAAVRSGCLPGRPSPPLARGVADLPPGPVRPRPIASFRATMVRRRPARETPARSDRRQLGGADVGL